MTFRLGVAMKAHASRPYALHFPVGLAVCDSAMFVVGWCDSWFHLPKGWTMTYELVGNSDIFPPPAVRLFRKAEEFLQGHSIDDVQRTFPVRYLDLLFSGPEGPQLIEG